VFPLHPHQAAGNENCGCAEVADWSGLEAQRYDTAGEAHTGHERLVAIYMEKCPTAGLPVAEVRAW